MSWMLIRPGHAHAAKVSVQCVRMCPPVPPICSDSGVQIGGTEPRLCRLALYVNPSLGVSRCRLQPHPSHEAARRIPSVLLVADRIEGAGVPLQGVERVNDSGGAHGGILTVARVEWPVGLDYSLFAPDLGDRATIASLPVLWRCHH